jgi:hypothetical protein
LREAPLDGRAGYFEKLFAFFFVTPATIPSFGFAPPLYRPIRSQSLSQCQLVRHSLPEL